MNRLVELGKQGIAFARQGYQPQTELIFTKLNELKPEMVEEATRNAREVWARCRPPWLDLRESDKLSAALSGQNRFSLRRAAARTKVDGELHAADGYFHPPVFGAACGCALVGDRLGLAVPQQTHALHRFPFACHEIPTPGCVPV
jgi:hypothetical protein